MKHFIDISNFELKKLDSIIQKAKQIKKNHKKFYKKCKNKTLGMIFQKDSTRTRASFTVGFQKLGGNTIELNPKSIGFGKRESIEDISTVLSSYVDGIIARVNSHDSLLEMSKFSSVPIINALSDLEHPCQVIADLLTISENKVIEIGPGKVLTGLIKRISNNFDITNIEYVTDIDKIKNEI